MATQAFLQQAYLAYFGRPADVSGSIAYANKSNAEVLNAFSASPESVALYGTGFGPAQVNAIYQVLFGRPAEAAGLTYWTAEVAAGRLTPAAAALGILTGAQNADAVSVSNKIVASAAFTAALDTNPEILGYSGDAAAASARTFLGTVTATAATQAQIDAAVIAAVAVGGVTGQIFSLTTGIDTGALFTGTSGNDTFNSLDGAAAAKTFTALDSIDGGAGTDTLNITQSASFAPVASATVKNIEIANITSAADVVVNTTAWTGLTNLNVVAAVATAASVTAAATTDVVASVGTMAATTATVNGGKAVTVTATGLTNLTATTNAISVGETTAAAGAVIVNATGSLAADAQTLGQITVVGGTSIAVNETLTATAAFALATKTGGVTALITGSNVIATGNASTTSVSVTQSAAVAAVASSTVGVVGIANGTVTITDGNLATASDTIATVTLNYYGNSTVASNVLSTVNVTGGATAATASGALQLNTTATDTSVVATTLALNSAGGAIGAITGSQAAKYTTVNVTSAAASTISDVTFAAATTLNFSGAGVTTLSALNAGNVKLTSITSTGAGVTIGAELATGTAFTGGAGVETISIGGTTKAINMGAGNDVVTVSTTTMGAGGSVNGGDGIDTLVANTNGSAFSGLPQFTGFETLRVAGTSAQGAHNAVGFTALELGATAAAVSSFTNVAAGVGLTVLAAPGGAHTVTLADATGLVDIFNLTLKSAATIDLSTNGITVAGVETINITNTDTLTTTASGINTNKLNLTADAVKTIMLTGNAGLNFTGSTFAKVTSFDASGVTGAATDAANLGVTYASGNATVGEVVSIKGGSGNDSLTGSSTANDTILGGDGIDTLTYTGGTDVFTGGAGKDVFVAGAIGTKTSYLSITDATAGDTMNLVALSTNGVLADKTAAQMLASKVTLGAAATFDQYLDSAAAGNGSIASVFSWFQFGGDTYAVVDSTAGAAFTSAADSVIKLVGLVNLGTASMTSEVITFA